MGEKKRRLAAGFKAPTPSERALDERINDYARECAALEASVAANPADHTTLYRISSLRNLLSLMQRERGDEAALASANLNQALGAITQALEAAPQIDDYWTHFAECLRFADISLPLHPRARDLLDRTLDHPAVAPSMLANAIVSLVRSHPAMARIKLRAEVVSATSAPVGAGLSQDADLSKAGDGAQSENTLAALAEVFDEPLLRKLLTLGIVADPMMESLIVLARRLVLNKLTSSPSNDTALNIESLAAIAHQCFACEYVFDESPEESAQIEELIRAIEQSVAGGTPYGHPSSLPDATYRQVLYACYRPMSSLPNAQWVEASLLRGSKALAELAKRQITEPALEREILATLPRGEVLADSTSVAVGRLYEENPYPRWMKCPTSLNPLGFRETIYRFIPSIYPADVPNEDIDILIAGCGTGMHSIETARRYPRARILAVDLSLASLAYAKRKTAELGITNVEYQRRDILSLAALAQRFDLIESIGVLHHLRDPLAGWHVLRGLLKPRGLMRVGLYSEIARRDIARLREEVVRHEFPPTLEGIRRCRAMVRPMLDENDPLTFARSPDFFCASGCRDLLFHVMEHCFTLPRIANALEELGLEFLSFMLPTQSIGERYRAQFPDDVAMTNLAHWHSFEQANPWIFKGLYNFWMRAAD